MKDDILRYEITIHPNEDYQMDIIYADDDELPVDMTGWTVEAQLREFPEAHDGLDFTCSADSEKITISMAHDLTEGIGYNYGYYDVYITSPEPDSIRTRLIGGKAYILPRSTR